MGYNVSTVVTGVQIRAGVPAESIIAAMSPLLGEAMGVRASEVTIGDLEACYPATLEVAGCWGRISYCDATRTVSWSIHDKFVADSYLERLKSTAEALATISGSAFRMSFENEDIESSEAFFFGPTDESRRAIEIAHQIDAAIRILPADAAKRQLAAELLRTVYAPNPSTFRVLYTGEVFKDEGVTTPAAAAAEVRRQIADDESIAHHFQVVDADSGTAFNVDLDEHTESRVLAMS